MLQKDFTFAGTKRVIPSGQNRPILPTRVANQNTGFASFCPLSHIIKPTKKLMSRNERKYCFTVLHVLLVF